MSFVERLKTLRINKGLSKSDLSQIAEVHHVQIGRYENKGAHPSADVLAKLANALDSSVEFLLNRNKENLANNTLNDKELLSQFKTIENFSTERKKIIKELISAFILKSNLQQQLSA